MTFAERSLEDRPYISAMFIVALVLAHLHILRNISPIFVGLYAAISIAALFQLLLQKRSSISNSVFLILFLWAYAIIQTLTQSYNLWGPHNSPVIGILRISYIVPVALILVLKLSFRDRIFVFRVALFFGVVAAASIPYQYAMGPISWFAEASERAGLTRFGSAIGSLTVFGSLAGAYAFLAFWLLDKPLLRLISVILIFMASILSLQKSGVTSILIAIVFAVLCRLIRKSDLYFVIPASLGFLFFSALSADTFVVQNLLAFGENLAGMGDSRSYSDVTLIESLADRTMSLPFTAIEFWAGPDLLSGAGAYGASGGLGYPHLPHPHNLIFEIIIIWGALGLFMACLLLFITFRAFIDAIFGRPSIHRIASSLFVLVILPSLFQGGIFYQPVSAILFFNCLVFLFAVQFKRGREDRQTYGLRVLN